MNIPFADLIDKAKSFFVRPPKNSRPLPLPERPDKPESDKFAKTVTPNAVMTLTPEGNGIASAPTPRIVSAGRTSHFGSRDLPPAVALALEPRVERTLSVALSDVIDQVPEGYLKPKASFDTSRRVLLKAADVEKGMASGRPTIAINAIYQQMPEIFMHAVPAGDGALVPLPFEKMMNELSQLLVRHDQTKEQVSQQFETPFLQVTMEDTKKFGTTMEPIELAAMPEVSAAKMQLATAEALAAAQPETKGFAPASPGMASRGNPLAQPLTAAPTPRISLTPTPPPAPTARAPISLSSPPPAITPERNGTASTSKERVTSPKPISLVPLNPLPPMAASIAPPTAKEKDSGTGEPAFPRVPASSGPPVPQVSPAKIAFAMPETTEGLGTLPIAEKTAREKSAAEKPTATPPMTEPESTFTPVVEPQVTLPLRAIMQTLPPMQLNGDASTVAPEAKISFPFSQIAAQLASGKIAIPPRDFHAALPEEYRALFVPDAVEAAVPLSLPDVLANLPGNALQMRSDQELERPDEVFETPFSQKADEDAKRFQSQAPAPELKKEEPKQEEPVVAMVVPKTPIAAAVEAMAKEPAFDAKAAIAQAKALPGVTSCAVSFADGLSIAGNIPENLGLEGLSAVAPSLLQKIEKHMLETKLGGLTGLTVHGEISPATFFAAGNICVTAVHDSSGLSAETRKELSAMTKKLSQTYAQPESQHVDH